MHRVGLQKSFLLLILLLIAGFKSYAQEVPCTNRDLRNHGALNVVRNQGSLGWCFAYAAADIYGYALNTRVSAFDIAISNYRENPSYGINSTPLVTSLRAGRQDFVYSSLQRWGICPDRRLSTFYPDAPAKIVAIENMANQVANIRETGAARRSQIVRLVQRNFQMLVTMIPGVPYNQMVEAFEDIDPRERPLVSVVDNFCQGHRLGIDQLHKGGASYVSRDYAVTRIRHLLNQNYPVLLGYNAQTLREPNFVGPVNHASVIVGTRMFRGRCEYLLKNSWGEFNRNNYHPSLWNVFSADNNYVWIPEHQMRNMAKEVHWVTRRPI